MVEGCGPSSGATGMSDQSTVTTAKRAPARAIIGWSAYAVAVVSGAGGVLAMGHLPGALFVIAGGAATAFYCILVLPPGERP